MYIFCPTFFKYYTEQPPKNDVQRPYYLKNNILIHQNKCSSHN